MKVMKSKSELSVNLGTNCWQLWDEPLLLFHTQVLCWNYKTQHATPSLKQNISCIGIKHLGNKISVLITVWAKVCGFFGFGIAAPRNLRLRCMIQQTLEGSRFKAPHCYYNYTRGRKTAMQHFLTAFYTELVYKAHNKYQKMDFGIISGHAWIIGSVTFVPVPTSPADTGFRALFWFMQAPQPSAIWQLLLS